MSAATAHELLDTMTDMELLAWCDEAKKDLEIAAAEEHNSEWHGTCFAALYVICTEMSKRGFTERKLN